MSVLEKPNDEIEYSEPHWDLLDEQLRRAFKWIYDGDGDKYGGNDFIVLQAICLCRDMINPRSYNQAVLARDFLYHVYHTADFIMLAAGNTGSKKLERAARIIESLSDVYRRDKSFLAK